MSVVTPSSQFKHQRHYELVRPPFVRKVMTPGIEVLLIMPSSSSLDGCHHNVHTYACGSW